MPDLLDDRLTRFGATERASHDTPDLTLPAEGHYRRRWLPVPAIVAAAAVVLVIVLGAVIIAGHRPQESVSGSAATGTAPAFRHFPGEPPDGAGLIAPAVALMLPYPDGRAGMDHLIAEVGWFANGDLGVVLWGSGGCPLFVADVTVLDAHHLRMGLHPYPSGAACTQDLAPHTTVVPRPASIDPSETLIVDIPELKVMFRVPPV